MQWLQRACWSIAASVPAVVLLHPRLAWADEAGSAAARGIGPGQIWTFFFLLLGPIKIIAPFVRLTEGGDGDFVRRMALRGIGFAILILCTAALVGVRMLDKYDLQPAELILAGGLLVFLVALRSLLEQLATAPRARRPEAAPPTLQSAFSPLAFPVIVTPTGIAAVIVFTALAPDDGTKLIVAALLGLVLMLNLFVMLLARRILHWAAMPLQVLGAVLGVVQLALGLHLVLISLHMLGVISYAGR